MSNVAHDPRCHGIQTDTPTELRSRKLAALDVGDIVGATLGGNILSFLVTRADETFVDARAISAQFQLRFDRATGEATEIEDGQTRHWRIVSMQPLPLEYHNLMLAHDRQRRLGSNGTTNPLGDGEIRAILYLADHWAAYPI